jgi:hypothetical protein
MLRIGESIKVVGPVVEDVVVSITRAMNSYSLAGKGKESELLMGNMCGGDGASR